MDGHRGCYEFYGCYYHGCMICFLNCLKVIQRKHCENGFHPIDNAYQDTMAHELEIRSLLKFEDGFDKWITIWEHEFNGKSLKYKEYLKYNVMY